MAQKTKITPDKKQAIIEDYNSGSLKRREIALKYGISEGMVSFIVFPDKLDLMRLKAIKNDRTIDMNRKRVYKCREKKKNVKNE